jgi:hypothetical protein
MNATLHTTVAAMNTSTPADPDHRLAIPGSLSTNEQIILSSDPFLSQSLTTSMSTHTSSTCHELSSTSDLTATDSCDLPPSDLDDLMGISKSPQQTTSDEVPTSVRSVCLFCSMPDMHDVRHSPSELATADTCSLLSSNLDRLDILKMPQQSAIDRVYADVCSLSPNERASAGSHCTSLLLSNMNSLDISKTLRRTALDDKSPANVHRLLPFYSEYLLSPSSDYIDDVWLSSAAVNLGSPAHP